MRVVKPHCAGDVTMCRYADDFVCAFQYKRDAELFYQELPKRLAQFNLEVAEDKTQCLRFSRFEQTLKNRFAFLGFEFHWRHDSKGIARVFRRTARKKLQETQKNYSEFIRKNRHLRTPILLDKLTQKLRGHYAYFGAVGNKNDLYSVYYHVVGKLYKWLNRRSGRKSMTWVRLKQLMTYRSMSKPVCRAIKREKRIWL